MTQSYTISDAMQASIEAVKKYFSYGSEMELTFGVEFDECNRNEEGCYDWCEVHHPMDSRNKYALVNYDGEIFDCGDGYYPSAEDLHNAMKK